MRQMNYRAWHPKGKMISWNTIYVDFLSNLLNEGYVFMQSTGFNDKDGKEIFEGDILSDWTETDEGLIQSKMQVFWNESKGSWHLDSSSKQDKTYSTELWFELKDFEYKITGNIYEKTR